MDSNKDARVMLAARILLLCEESSRKKSVTEAMKDAGYSEAEIKCKTRAKEAAVRRTYKDIKNKKELCVDIPIQEVDMGQGSPISPLCETTSSSNSSSHASETVLTGMSSKIIPGIKMTRKTPHQAHVMAQNAFVLKRLHDSATKEATLLWIQASDLEKKGKPHQMKKDIIQSINNKAEYKGIVQVHDRTIRRLVSEGIIGVTPPRRGNPGNIPEGAYKALKTALTSFISIHQASGKNEYSRTDLSKILNDVINESPRENRRGNKLMKRLQSEFGPDICLGKREKVEERRVKWTTFQNLKMWGDSAKEAIIELGFGCQRVTEDSVAGEINFFDGQSRRIINFDETRITLDQAESRRAGRPSFVFFNPNKPRPGSSVNKSSFSLTVIVGGTASGELVPPHFQFTTDGQNEEVQVWKTSIIKYMHDIYGKFGYEVEKYHPCTFGMNEKGGMNTYEFEEYLKNSLVTLYPDAADVPGRRVLLKADSGPGRKNTELMAYLRVRGFYFIPGLPNSTHVTQEMELLFGQLKSVFCNNLEKLTRGCLQRNLSIPSSAEIVGLLLFGGSYFPDENDTDEDKFINSFQVAGCKEKMLSYFEKIGFVPFTRNYLKNKAVRHDSVHDSMAEEYAALEHQNYMACSFLNVYGYNGHLLLARIDRNVTAKEFTEQQPLTRPINASEKAKALAAAVTHGQQFKVTGGHHLTSDDFMIAEALGNLEKEQKAMASERRARQKQQQQFESARPLLEKPEHTLLSKDLDILLRYKLGELPGNLKTKSDKMQRWQQVKDQQVVALEPWTDENEQQYIDLMEKQITLEDTALGRQREVLKQQMMSGLATLSLQERREMRKQIDDLDAQV
jgi:hypothetical protein